MVSAWRRWRTKRHLAALLEPGETVGEIERLAMGGWWVLTDRALYAITNGATTVLPRREVRSVESRVGTFTTVTVVSHSSHVLIGDLAHESTLVEHLQHEPRPD